MEGTLDASQVSFAVDTSHMLLSLLISRHGIGVSFAPSVRGPRRCGSVVAILSVAILLAWPRDSYADNLLDRITFTDPSKQTIVLDGKVLVEAEDGGILLLGRDRRLWTITPEQIQRREQTGRKFTPYTADELGRRLKAELGEHFEIVSTKHYIICTNAGRKYARWCGALFERLLASFRTHWRAKQLELHTPESPLVAIVFADERQFARFAAKDADQATATSKGYYSIRTNRMVLYDLTAGPHSRPAASLAEINRKVAASPFNVATVVHEATHQIAFNSGLHTRYADNPLWLTEGMAMYFETPDLRSRTGWRTVGKPNALRFRQFQDYAAKRRKNDSLLQLIQSDDRFRDAELTADAYAEAWALSYFLIKTKRKEYTEYLKRISAKGRLIWDKPEQRLAEFQTAFGEDLAKLDRDFLRYISRLR